MFENIRPYALVILLLGFNFNCHAGEETAKNKYLNWHKEFLLNNLTQIKLNSTLIYFESQGKLGIYDVNNNVLQKFSLAISGKFNLKDKHGSTEYELIKFDDKGITISYLSTFNHQSFGTDKTTIDSGTILLQYK